MFPFVSGEFVFLVGFAFVYHRAAAAEDIPGLYWSGPSVVTSWFTWKVVGGGLSHFVLGQIVLLVLIAVVRSFHDPATRRHLRKADDYLRSGAAPAHSAEKVGLGSTQTPRPPRQEPSNLTPERSPTTDRSLID